jgi:hypothetical protein
MKITRLITLVIFTLHCLLSPAVATANVIPFSPGNIAVGTGSGGGAQILQFGSNTLGRINPWVATIGLGVLLYEYFYQDEFGNKVSIKPKNAPDYQPTTEQTQPVQYMDEFVSNQQLEYYTGYVSCGATQPGSGFATAMAACGCAQPQASGPTPTSLAHAGDPAHPYCYGTTTTSGGNVVPWGSWFTRNVCPSNSTWNGTACVKPVETCPAGWHKVGSYCTSDSPKFPFDGYKSYRNDNGTPVPDPKDPDPAPTQQPAPERTGVDPAGNPYKEKVELKPDGGLKIETRTQTQPDGLPSSVTNQQIETDAGGKVINISTTSNPGTLPTTDPTTSPQTPLVKVEFPKDYSRDTKQCGYDAAHPCAVEIKTEGDLTDIPTTPIAEAYAQHESVLTNIGQGGDHGFNWTWNPFESITTGACTDPRLDAGGFHMAFEGFCDRVGWFRSLAEFTLYLATGWTLFGIMTGRRED